MAWNIDNAWPEPAKLVLRRRIKEMQQRAIKKERRQSKLDRLRRQIAKLEEAELEEEAQ